MKYCGLDYGIKFITQGVAVAIMVATTPQDVSHKMLWSRPHHKMYHIGFNGRDHIELDCRSLHHLLGHSLDHRILWSRTLLQLA